MPGFELHFTDAWLTFLFAVAGLAYLYLFKTMLQSKDDIQDCLRELKIDIARIKIVLRLNTDKKIIRPEHFKHASADDA